MRSFLALLAAALGSANAHTIFQRVHVNGVDQGYLYGMRYPTYDGPITDVTSNDIICNGGPNPLVTPFTTNIINIPAGATVQAEWHHVLQPNGYNSADVADPIDPGHLGPVMAYMAKIPDATQTTVTGLSWFKIFEDGFDGTHWGVDRLYAAKGLQTFTIPSCIPPGNYLLRAEIIALHAASTYPGAQFYMECAQINITGGGSTQPATVSLPGAYHGTDPGITIDIYYPTVTNYTIPGPRPFTCSGGGGTTVVTTTTAKASTTATTSKTTTTSTTTTTPTTTKGTTTTPKTSTTTTTASGATQTKYGQCGGQGYTGPTVCASGSTCQASSVYYSQCL